MAASKRFNSSQSGCSGGFLWASGSRYRTSTHRPPNASTRPPPVRHGGVRGVSMGRTGPRYASASSPTAEHGLHHGPLPERVASSRVRRTSSPRSLFGGLAARCQVMPSTIDCSPSRTFFTASSRVRRRCRCTAERWSPRRSPTRGSSARRADASCPCQLIAGWATRQWSACSSLGDRYRLRLPVGRTLSTQSALPRQGFRRTRASRSTKGSADARARLRIRFGRLTTAV